MKWRHIFVALGLCILVLPRAVSDKGRGSSHTKRIEILRDSPTALLKEADRLSWLGNWYAAGPLYSAAETRFHLSHDLSNEIHARLGRIRSESTRKPLHETVAALEHELSRPAVQKNEQLRMWGLALSASMRIDSDSMKAKKEWSACLEIANALGESQWAARAKGELGTIAFLEGNTAEAVNLLGGAILSAFKSRDTGSQVRLLSLLGLGFNEEHRFSEALVMFKRAIAIAEQTPDAGLPFLAYRGEAAALAGLNQMALSKQLLTKALGLAKAQADRVHEADLLAEAGRIAVADHDLAKAEVNFGQAGRIAQRMDDYRTVSEVMFDLSRVQRQLGDLRGADLALRAGLAASRHLGDRYYLPRDLNALAHIKVAEKKYREADKLYGQAEDVLDEILANQHSFEENTAHAGSMSSIYLEHFRLAQRMRNLGRAFQVIERVRGRFVASQLFLREQSGARSRIITKLQGEIAAIQLQLMRSGNSNSKSSFMEQLLSNERQLAFQLNAAGLRRRETLVTPASLKAVQAALTNDEVFVEYVLDENDGFCLVVTNNSTELIKLKADTTTIRALTRSYLSELKAMRPGEHIATELYQVLLAPVVSSFPQFRIIISPDDILNALPFEALRDDHGFVVRSKVVTYTPSGTVLWLLRKKKVQEGERPLLAVGAVDYKFARALPDRFTHNPTAAVVLRGLAEIAGARLTDLPGSRNEVSAIAQVAGHGSEVLLGDKATESGFKAQHLEQFRIIHLATHAVADEHYPDRSALVLGATPQNSDDGLLQVREIMGLRLRADLVTLSACDTNLGTDEHEAGVVNLEEAFLIAGARAVVASLWNVEDNSTTALMKAFYTHLAEHEDKALALSHAKRDMLDRYGDGFYPYYWAAFVMAGEGRGVIPFSH
jgi:CHAT domain-containing protein/tetratricopeptide (TPR) repeat protein